MSGALWFGFGGRAVKRLDLTVEADGFMATVGLPLAIFRNPPPAMDTGGAILSDAERGP